MKVSALLGVKNEASLIGRCIDHLFAIGVDEVVVEDYGSTDGTLDIVNAYGAPRVRCEIFDENQDATGAAWGELEAELARSTGADWVLFLDADEFWLPATGSVRDALHRARAEVLRVRRHNVVPLSFRPSLPDSLNPDRYAEIMCSVESVKDLRGQLDARDGRPWVVGTPMPKIAVRPRVLGRVRAGHHHAFGLDGELLDLEHAADLLVAHLPFTDIERFRRKVSDIRDSLALQPTYHAGNTAWHWKRWVALDEAGALQAEFDRQLLDREGFEAARRAGRIRSVVDILAEAGGR